VGIAAGIKQVDGSLEVAGSILEWAIFFTCLTAEITVKITVFEWIGMTAWKAVTTTVKMTFIMVNITTER